MILFIIVFVGLVAGRVECWRYRKAISDYKVAIEDYKAAIEDYKAALR